VERWFQFAGKKIAGTYPDETLEMVLSQSKASLAMQAMSWMFSEPQKPPNEVVRVLLALARTGCIDTAKPICMQLAKTISSNAEVASSFNSPYVWTFISIYNLHKSEEIMSSVSPFILENIPLLLESVNEWISPVEDVSPIEVNSSEITKTVLDSDTSPLEDVSVDEVVEAESTPVVDPISVVDLLTTHLWNLAALQAYLNNIEIFNSGESEIAIAKTLSMYESYVAEQFNNFEGTDIELSVSMISSLVALVGSSSLLRMNEIAKPILESMIGKNFDSQVSRGLLKYPAPIDKSSSHHALQLAHYYILENKRSQVETILEKTLAHVSEYYFLPDWVNLKSGGGSSGDGCSIPAAADILLLLRDMMVIEEGPNIAMLQGIPESWFTSEKPLILLRIPTTNGTIDVEIGASTNQHQIEITMKELPEELIVYMPSHFPLHMVKIFGGSIVDRISEPSAKLKIIPLSNTIVLTFHK